MDLFTADHFPTIETNHNFHLFFQEEIVSFYFYTYRDTSVSDTNALITRFDHLLFTLKNNLHNQLSGSMEYLILLFRLLGYTRSIHSGKGEHDLSYLMLCSWYKFFPTLAIYALHRFVVCTKDQSRPFGSWRDIKYLCRFIERHTYEKQNHAFIDICCDFVNSQLKKDTDIQNIYALPKNIHSISYVSKWIPREHKQVGWLYDKLVLHWMKLEKPYILQSTTDETYIAAIHKGKRLYRKKIASLNKMIDTTQIKQCARNRRSIIPKNVSSFTQMKQPNLIFGHGENDILDRQLCSQHFTEWFDLDQHGCNLSPSPLPMHYYVKRAIQLISNTSQLDDKLLHYQKSILNNQWTSLSNSFHTHHVGNSIPIVDVSDNMSQYNDDYYYAAIGYAILLAQKSLFTNRILLVDQIPTWIELDTTHCFVSIVQHIQLSIQSSFTIANFNSAFHLIGKTIRNSELSGQDIRNLRLVLFSTTSNLTSSLLHYDNILSIFNLYCFHVPFIVYWNVSNEVGELFPCSIHQHSTIMISGTSTNLLHVLLNKFKHKHTTPYKTICNLLRSPHYNILENYIHHIISR